MTHPEDTSMKGIKGSDRCDARARRARQGISPVIATVILIAVAVIIGVAVAAYAGGLFSAQSGSGGLLIRSAVVTDDSETNRLDGTIRIENQGARADSVTSIVIGETVINDPDDIGVDPNATNCDGTDDERIPGSTVTNICFTNDNSIGLQPGQTFTIRVNLGSGNVLTYTTTVAP